MNRSETLERWTKIVASIDAETGDPKQWADEPPAHFLHAFRTDPSRLSDLFADMPEMAGVLDRLNAVFNRAGAETGHLYFVVSRPRPMTAAEVRHHARAWLNQVGTWVKHFDLAVDDGVSEFLSSDSIEVDLVREPSKRLPTDRVHPVRAAIYDAATAFGTLTFMDNSAVGLLIEPLYMLACSYELAYWVLSPGLPETKDDPFGSFAALWEAGIELEFTGTGAHIRVTAGGARTGA